MGLEAVEIVMAVEDRFGIAIEDAEAEKTATPGMLIELVMSKVGRTNDAACLTQRAFHRLRGMLMRQFGLKRNQIRPDTPLAELFPHPGRKDRLRQVLAEVGANKDIELDLPGWLHKLMLIGFIGSIVVPAFYAVLRPVPAHNAILNYILSSPLLLALICPILFLVTFLGLTRGLRREFPPATNNLGQLARWVMANAPDVVQAPPGQWSREQVAEIVKEIVIDTLGCGKEYREDAQFVKDLGLG